MPSSPQTLDPSRVRSLWFAIYDYDSQGEDELGLRKGDVIEVLSKDYKISGDDGWWTGKCQGKVSVKVNCKVCSRQGRNINFTAL